MNGNGAFQRFLGSFLFGGLQALRKTKTCPVYKQPPTWYVLAQHQPILSKIHYSTRRLYFPLRVQSQELHVERAALARMGFLDKAEELDVMIEAERVRLKKVQHIHRLAKVSHVVVGRAEPGQKIMCMSTLYVCPLRPMCITSIFNGQAQ